jgi:hypothetical protein
MMVGRFVIIVLHIMLEKVYYSIMHLPAYYKILCNMLVCVVV